MIRINNSPILNKYNLNKDKMSNSIKEDIGQYKKNSLTIDELLHNLKLELNKTNKAILIELIKTNMPLKEDFFADISKFLDSFEDNSSTEDLQTKIKVALLLKKLNLPLNIKFFKLFKENTNLKDNLLKELINWSSKDTLTNINNKQETSQNKNNLLKEFKLEDNSKNKEILKSMLKFGIKINKENFISISKEISTYDFKQIEITTLLKKLQLPTNNQALRNLFSQLKLTDSDNLSTSIEKLVSTLLTKESKTDSFTLIFPKIREIIDENPKILLEIKESLSKREFNILSKKLSLSSKEEVKILKKLVKEELIPKIITQNNLTIENLKDSLTTINSNNDKADKLLKALFHLTGNNSEEISQSSDKLLKQLLTHRTLNYNNDLTTLFLPFFIEENINLAEIQIDQESKRNSSENNDLNLSFAVRTAKLGDVEIKLKIKDKQINGLLNTDNPKTLRLLQENLNQLRTNLANSNYQVNYLHCKLSEPEIITKNEEGIKMTNVDFKI
ncbi:hypothetical protein U472_01575 [Orenia metallireducens]|uniref:Flagellar hook-length control protein-like C-terminal domain-containing protein n=1 Tax=Orenia metallireducens TaxID=1413210 RepID=A0A1C0AC51_9FIRM|nr:flagellar hook-length control protein FliK [Orenia metallireducens]OCL27918.1 hypothetical protein U472_01575 [Orenia metallireducens]